MRYLIFQITNKSNETHHTFTHCSHLVLRAIYIRRFALAVMVREALIEDLNALPRIRLGKAVLASGQIIPGAEVGREGVLKLTEIQCLLLQIYRMCV